MVKADLGNKIIGMLKDALGSNGQGDQALIDAVSRKKTESAPVVDVSEAEKTDPRKLACQEYLGSQIGNIFEEC